MQLSNIHEKVKQNKLKWPKDILCQSKGTAFTLNLTALDSGLLELFNPSPTEPFPPTLFLKMVASV